MSPNDNEALYKVSSLYNQPSWKRSEHKIFVTDRLTDRQKVQKQCLPQDGGGGHIILKVAYFFILEQSYHLKHNVIEMYCIDFQNCLLLIYFTQGVRHLTHSEETSLDY
jgi:hypothetical protein